MATVPMDWLSSCPRPPVYIKDSVSQETDSLATLACGCCIYPLTIANYCPSDVGWTSIVTCYYWVASQSTAINGGGQPNAQEEFQSKERFRKSTWFSCEHLEWKDLAIGQYKKSMTLKHHAIDERLSRIIDVRCKMVCITSYNNPGLDRMRLLCVCTSSKMVV